MKRFLPFILIFSVILQFFAPFYLDARNIKVNKNIVHAESRVDKEESLRRVTWDLDGYKKAFPLSALSSNGSMYIASQGASDLSLAVVVDTGVEELQSAFGNWWHVKPKASIVETFNPFGLLSGDTDLAEFKNEQTFILFLEESDTKKTGYIDITQKILGGNIRTGRNRPSTEPGMPVKVVSVVPILDNITPSKNNGLSYLSPGKNYSISLYYLTNMENVDSLKTQKDVDNLKGSGETILGLENNGPYYIKIASETFPVASETNQIITTDPENQIGGDRLSGAAGDNMPVCSLIKGWDGVLGCIIRIVHTLFYKPTAALFGLAGQLMDVTLMYSVSDSSYRSPFISEGWKIVRDLCNMFFVFILLYIAFKTILDMGGAKNKNMVINVVIIGLFINFSLFATHLIIDASNILARVFYNPEVIRVGTRHNGEILSELGSLGEIKVSEAIVSKINPQKLLQQQDSIANSSANQISSGNYLLIEILAIAVNIVGMLIFLSISFSLIGRVVGLWIAMILSPIAFLTFTIPELKTVDYVGWSKWWIDTLKAAFMAPVFVFFLYIIAVFIDSGFGLKNLGGSDTNGVTSILSIIIPFVLIMFLLNTAKKVAVGMSGKIAEQFSGHLKSVGGLALGATALGVGALGRSVVGKTMARASRGETSVQKFETAKMAKLSGDASLMNNLTRWEKYTGGALSYVTGGGVKKVKQNDGSIQKEWKYSALGTAAGKTTTSQDITTKKIDVIGVERGLGGILNKKQNKVGEIEKARSKYSEAIKEAGFEGINEDNLSATQVKKVKKAYKDKNKSDFENEAKNGEIALRDISGQEIKSLANPTQVIKGERTFKADRELSVESDYITKQQSLGRTTLTRETLSKQDKAKIKDQIDVEFRAVLKTTVDHRSNEKFIETKNKSSEKLSMLDRGIAGSNTASYDVRNLTKLKADKKDGLFNRIPVALIAAIATGVRTGIKGIGLSKGGAQVNKSLGKDLGSVIVDSLKNSNININMNSGDKKK